FLNVYEHRRWGESEMRDVAGNLQAAGQDVALHTHPQWAYDPLRSGMYQYSLDDQISIIREGVQLLTAWTGRPVVAHRAGDYAADERTLEALERNGIRLDSSLFTAHPHSRLVGLGLPNNLPAARGQLTEIPVTVYQREERSQFLGDWLVPVNSLRKIDADGFFDADEAKAAMDAVVEADLPFLVVFLHSFSLLAKPAQDGVLVSDQQSRDVFRAILDHVAERGLPVVTMRALAEFPPLPTLVQGRDVIPRVVTTVGLHRYLWHRLRGAGILVGAVSLAVILVAVATGAVLISGARRRRGSAAQ
ncbi:MAG: hypothetical protein ACREA0_09565, partial [bacterium]